MIKINISEYKNNIFNDLKQYNPILTVGGYNDFNAMTVSWGHIGTLWNQNIAIVYIRKTRHTYGFAERNDSFTLSFLPSQYKKEIALFGALSGRDVDKFKETNLHAAYEPDYNGYIIEEADYVIRMKKLASFEFDEKFVPEEAMSHYPNKDFHKAYFCLIQDILVNENNEDYKELIEKKKAS